MPGKSKSSKLTCCEVINFARGTLNYNPETFTPGDPFDQAQLYFTVLNCALEAYQNGLVKLSKRTCDVNCCEVASNALNTIFEIFVQILAIIAQGPAEDQKALYKKFLCLLEESIKKIVKSSRKEQLCCVVSNKQISGFSFELFILENGENEVFDCILKVIQCNLDDLLECKLKFECCEAAANGLVNLQTIGLDHFNRLIQSNTPQEIIESEFKFFEKVADLIVKVAKTNSKCCVEAIEAIVNVYQNYAGPGLLWFQSDMTDQVTICLIQGYTKKVLLEITRIVNEKVKQTNCCPETADAIQNIYRQSIVNFDAIYVSFVDQEGVSNESQREQARKNICVYIKTALEGINDAIDLLLSGKCEPCESSKSSTCSY